MKARRWLLGGLVVVIALCLFGALVVFEATEQTTNTLAGWDDWMKLVRTPVLTMTVTLLAGMIGLLLFQAHAAEVRAAADAERARAAREAADAEAAKLARERYAVQLVAAQLISPINDRGYHLDVELEKYLKLGPFDEPPATQWAPATNIGNVNAIARYTELLISEAVLPLRLFVFLHNRTQELYLWDKPRLGGMPVFITTPASLTDADRAEIVRRNIKGALEFEDKPGDHWPPPVPIGFGGGPTIGFESLARAIEHLQATPAEPIFVIAADAPNHPKDEQTNESATLLILADPGRETGRRPLARIHRPRSATLTDANGTLLARSERVRRWQETLAAAAALGEVDLRQVKMIMTDFGRGSEAAAERTALVAQAITEANPDFEFFKHTKNLPGWLGDLGAATVDNNLIVAAYHAWRTHEPVLVIGTTDPTRAHAVLVRPDASQGGPMPPRKPQLSRGGREFNRLWWGPRKNGAADF